ncbi:MAG: hypothetical protein ACRD1I_07995 [Terriglobia bacterium]
MKSHSRAVLILALVALIVAVLRFFMQGWVESLGIPIRIGSFFASITIVLLVGLVIIFVREGLAANRRYLRAAAWYVPFAAWCQILVIAGILITAQTGATTYYQDTMGDAHRAAPTPAQHAMMHAVAFLPIAAIGLIVGAFLYWVAGRGRRANPALAN